jgi:integrase
MPTTDRTNRAEWMDKYNRWQINVQVDGERKSFYSSDPSPRGQIAAERKADKWREGLKSSDCRLDQMWAKYLIEIETTTGTANYRQKETMGRLWVLPRLKHKRLSKISTQDWQECIYAAYRKGLSRKTCINIRGTISGFVEFCDRCDSTLRRPKKLKIPKDAPVGERTILQPDDVRALFTVDTVTRYGQPVPCFFIHAWRFLVLTGLRPGEIAGLESRADIKDGIMHIRRARNLQDEITSGKTKNARRAQRLTSFALSVLDDQRRMLKQRGIISPWAFPGEDGDQMRTTVFESRWDLYRKQHGIASTLYELRHTMVSLVQNDMPDPLLKKVVGHGKHMDTTGTYGHDVDGDLDEAASIMEGVFGRILRDGNNTQNNTL